MNRISWDKYFSEFALLTSKRSPCHRLQVGCILIKDNHIIATGYNGFLPNAPHESIVIDNHEQATVHAEQNCIADCAKRGVSLEDSKIYITHYPCVNCFRSIAACGIKEIIYLDDYNNNPIVQELADDSGITIIQM